MEGIYYCNVNVDDPTCQYARKERENEPTMTNPSKKITCARCGNIYFGQPFLRYNPCPKCSSLVSVKFKGKSDTVEFKGTFEGKREAYDQLVGALKDGAFEADQAGPPVPGVPPIHVKINAGKQAARPKPRKKPTPLERWMP